MAYRNGTYVAFHAEGTSVPINTDMKYYNLLKAWHENEDIEFSMVNSHEKTSAVRDSSTKATLRSRLLERLRNSKNFLLIVGDTTRFDNDWVPFEIVNAIDTYRLPIIVAYPEKGAIARPNDLRSLWPAALRERIDNSTAHAMHMPFKKEPIHAAISAFSPDNLPKWGPLGIWTAESYQRWGIS